MPVFRTMTLSFRNNTCTQGISKKAGLFVNDKQGGGIKTELCNFSKEILLRGNFRFDSLQYEWLFYI